MITVSLHQVRFFSFHGLHEEEKKVKGEFIVDMDVSYEPDGTIGAIGDTVNYADVFAMLKERMAVPEELLETLAMDMAGKIRERWPQITELMIRIEKKHPPIHNFNGHVSVTYRKHY